MNGAKRRAALDESARADSWRRQQRPLSACWQSHKSGANNMTKLHEIYRIEINESLANKINKARELTEELQTEDYGTDRWEELKEERDELRFNYCFDIEALFKDMPF
jgi:hypothetical protein